MQTKVMSLISEGGRGEAMRLAAGLIRAGEVVAFPTETVYGLGADGLNPDAVKKIYEAKGRPGDNPLILHISDTCEIGKLVTEFSPRARRLAQAFWPGALTLVLPKSGAVPDIVTAGLGSVAVRCPQSEYARELIRACGTPLAAPSANASGRPSPTCAAHVLADLNGRIPLILDGGECALGMESTVVSLGEKCMLLRPGMVTKEMLESVMGEPVEVHEAVLAEASGVLPSPGMRHKHYAPKAEVYVAVGSLEAMAAKACKKYDVLASSGKSCTILATEQTRPFYFERNYVIMGDRNDPAPICARLFALLRDAEEACSDVLIIESLEAEGVGLAFMNRALRSAGFKLL